MEHHRRLHRRARRDAASSTSEPATSTSSTTRVPVDDEMSLDELRPHLFSLPDQPDRIPYRTSYYERNWGFCLSQRQLESMTAGRYRVRIDSTLRPGHLTYGEVSCRAGSRRRSSCRATSAIRRCATTT